MPACPMTSKCCPMFQTSATSRPCGERGNLSLQLRISQPLVDSLKGYIVPTYTVIQKLHRPKHQANILTDSFYQYLSLHTLKVHHHVSHVH